MAIISNISKWQDLVTTHEQTRKGFIDAALEKNRRAKPYIVSANNLRHFALQAKTPEDLLLIPQIRKGLLTASGLSDKALEYFTEEDKKVSINELIKNFLKPAGDKFVDELVYRFLLISGDSLGGKMRNLVGLFAQMKLVRHLLSIMDMMQIEYVVGFEVKSKLKWVKINSIDAFDDADKIKAIQWKYGNIRKVLFFNKKIPLVGNNVDICLYDCTNMAYSPQMIKDGYRNAIMLGELKGGIDPAGADEHWKTARTALSRIRESFATKNINIQTSFVGAAIEDSMAKEIIAQLSDKTLSYAINLTFDNQLSDYCEWLITLEKR